MKYIKKVSVSPIPEINGSVVDTFNVEDKTTNAPSIRAVEEKLTYSTEEKQIGYWIDGKPLYRKVYEGITASSGGVTNADSNFANKDIVHRYGEIKCDTNNANSIQIGCYVNNNYYSGAYLYGSTLYIYHPSNSNFYNKPYYLIVEYTKNTD